MLDLQWKLSNPDAPGTEPTYRKILKHRIGALASIVLLIKVS